VRGIDLDKNDRVVGTNVIAKDMTASRLLVMSKNGYGKTTKMSEYKTQGRGGSGIKTAQVTEKTGEIMVAKLITDEEAELVAISKKSQVIRVDVKEIPTLGRQTQGVRIMKMREGDSIASLSLI
jgi:DNA gyrase subunit A